MDNLTIALACVGGVVLAGVVAHGAWQARKAGPLRASQPAMPPAEPREPKLDDGEGLAAPANIAAVDDGGRIVVNDCPKGSRRVPGVIAPPYAAGNVTLLGGLGDNASTTIAEDISRGGVFIVGQSTVRNQPVGVYWRIP